MEHDESATTPAVPGNGLAEVSHKKRTVDGSLRQSLPVDMSTASTDDDDSSDGEDIAGPFAKSVTLSTAASATEPAAAFASAAAATRSTAAGAVTPPPRHPVLLPNSLALLNSATPGETTTFRQLQRAELMADERLLCLFDWSYNHPTVKQDFTRLPGVPTGCDAFAYAPGQSDLVVLYCADSASVPLLLSIELKDVVNVASVCTPVKDAFDQAVRCQGEMITRWHRFHSTDKQQPGNVPCCRWGCGVLLPTSPRDESVALLARYGHTPIAADTLSADVRGAANLHGLVTDQCLQLPEFEPVRQVLLGCEDVLSTPQSLLEWVRLLAHAWNQMYDTLETQDASTSASAASAAAPAPTWLSTQRAASLSMYDHFPAPKAKRKGNSQAASHASVVLSQRRAVSATLQNGVDFLHSLCKLPSLVRHLRAYQTGIDNKLATSEQYTLIGTKLRDKKHCLIDGYSGTGKTLCALHRACMLSQRLATPQRVVFVCFTKALVLCLQANWGDELRNVSFVTSQSLSVASLKEMRVAHVIVDEGQDVTTPQLQLLASELPPDGTMWVFRDQLQAYRRDPATYATTHHAVEAALTPVGSARAVVEHAHLSVILRHSVSIYHLVSDLIKSHLPLIPASEKKATFRVPRVAQMPPDPLKPEITDVQGIDNQFWDTYFAQLSDALDELINDTLAPATLAAAKPAAAAAPPQVKSWSPQAPAVQLAILTSYDPESKMWTDVFTRTQVWLESDAPPNSRGKFRLFSADEFYKQRGSAGQLILNFSSCGAVEQIPLVCDTFKCFAGLEALSVLALAPSTPNISPDAPHYLYTGLSRATARLRVISHQDHGLARGDGKQHKKPRI